MYACLRLARNTVKRGDVDEPYDKDDGYCTDANPLNLTLSALICSLVDGRNWRSFGDVLGLLQPVEPSVGPHWVGEMDADE